MASKKKQQKGKKKSRNNNGANKPVVLANNASMRTPSAKRGIPRAAPRKAHGPGHVHGVCAVTDPFCPAAKGVKWPDGTTGNTMTEQFRGFTFLSSNTDGNAAAAFAPGIPFGYLAPASYTISTVTFGTAYFPYKQNSMVSVYGNQARIVSFGIIVRCIASAVNASGVITIGTTSAVAPGSTLTLSTELYDELAVKAIQPGMEMCWISQPRGSSARAFSPQSTDAVLVDSEWTSLVVEIGGAPASTAMVSIEWFMNIEFMPIAHSAVAPLAKQNPPKIPVAENAVSKVHSSLGSIIEGGVKSVESKVAQMADDALHSVLNDPLGSLAALFAAF